MDREQEALQFLGFFGICKESIKILTTWSKIFTKITLSLILPFSFTSLVVIEIYAIQTRKIIHNFTQGGTTTTYSKKPDVISSESDVYRLAKLVYVVLYILFHLFSVSAVFFTVACIHTGKEITFRKVMTVIPKVCQRLFITLAWCVVIDFAYSVVSFLLISIAWRISFYGGGGGYVGYIVLCLLIGIYLAGNVYITAIFKLASVVSVLEDGYGIEAVIKSKALIVGKTRAAVAIILVSGFCKGGIWFLFNVDGGRTGMVGKIGYGALSLFLFSLIFLLSLLVQTVFYFVCKSYHHENIDKSALSDHLEAHLKRYLPLTTKDVQMEVHMEA